MPFLRTLILLAFAAHWTPISAQSSTTFDWSNLNSTANLAWVDCYSPPFQCTRLQVPLDYSDLSIGNAGIAIVRLPATVNRSSTEYLGPLLFNPGGPGGSGVDSMVQLGPLFQQVIGGQYDYVGFDPRGVSFSTPAANIFFSAAERAQWTAGLYPTSLNASSEALLRHWGLSQVLGELAEKRDQTQIFKYMSTDNVARDMLYITQKAGFEKISYYGISYGTVLGATFAALFPDKINRMIIDGVVDAEAWYSANLTIESTDTDKVLESFFTGCATAGPTLCAFHAATPVAISARLENLTNAVRAKPVPVVTPAGYGLVDYSLLRSVIFQSLYAPYDTFPALAQGLAALEGGDGSSIFGQSSLAQPVFQCSPNDTSNSIGQDAGLGPVECGDSVEITDSLAELTDGWLAAAKVSRFAEFLAGSFRIQCAGWKIRRQGRFLGPVSAANTSFPLLIATTVADPVAPAIAAHNTQSRFPGSVLLTQNSPGHTTFTTSSVCTLGHYRAYLLSGALPQDGTTCEPQATLFSGNQSTARRDIDDAMESFSATGREVLMKAKTMRFAY
ncbi:unnamed protein product [Mycena citricolor]|uniref:Uncharacterized protein n=1 Tax=Mycena citricolor TaxID=2018698 RepID=A0AAD2HJF3_9AGAR|nr:unnamed protein product [Mycena citricolor]